MSEIRIPPKLEIYHSSDERVDWNDPTRAQLVKSANVAHHANRKIEKTCNELREALISERRWRRWVTRALIATWTIGPGLIAGLIYFLVPWAIKGMMAAK